MELSLTTRPGRGCTVIRLSGVVDLATEPELRASLERELRDGVRHVVLDLAEVRLIDSTALGTIVSFHKRLRERAGQLCLVGVQPLVFRVLELTSVDRLVGLYDSVEAAEDDLAAARER
ncbi:hypothetical protein Val02_49110 [Virgisporangium aliadipatigenens]|uniref:Anti-sigma factor antagonist n=1 Tax=Virgisporangium aliadipatigenens TaxID=741659 RepID=A0A8J4DRD3_9ACTN|nr:hypothetical protein Val02_49110 [Virgisporangium aliadipatigenens]